MKRQLILVFLITYVAMPFATAVSPKEITTACASYLQSDGQENGQDIVSTEKNAEYVLKRIVGRVRTDVNPAGRPTADFYAEKDIVQRRKSGSGEALIQILSNHADANSPTALRVEEKAVVNVTQLNEFFAQSQSPEFAQNYNEGAAISWSQRDVPRGGHNFATITEYGKHLVFELGGNPSTFIIKPRFRKYYEFAEANAGNVAEYKSVLGELTAVELKITSTTGSGSEKFLDTEDTVFKPRIMVTDAIADEMKKLDSRSPKFLENLNALKVKIQEMKDDKNAAVNEAEKVASFIEALRWLLVTDPQFLQTEFVVKYERASYRLRTHGREYQFTADQKVNIYSPNAAITTNSLQHYIAQTPLFKSQPGEAFVELKSPVSDKQGKSALYLKLIELMEKNHLVNYKKGSGKYAIARYVEQGLQDKYVDKTLLEQGPKFWLIKGTSNLDALPKKNDFITQGEIEVAFPFTTSDKKIYRVLFRYRSTKQFDGKPRMGVLERVKLFDNYGAEIKVNDNFNSLIWQANERAKDEILGLEIDGNIIPFKTHLTAKDISDYNNFFMRYYAYQTDLRGRPRNLEDLSQVQGHLGLGWKSFKLKAENAVHFVIDRTKRIAIGALVTVSVVAAYDHYRDHLPFARPQQAQQQIMPSIPLHNMLILKGFYSEKLGMVELIANIDSKGNYYFTLPPDSKLKLMPNTILQLTDSLGLPLRFIVEMDPDGKTKLFLLSEMQK